MRRFEIPNNGEELVIQVFDNHEIFKYIVLRRDTFEISDNFIYPPSCKVYMFEKDTENIFLRTDYTHSVGTYAENVLNTLAETYVSKYIFF